MTTRADLHRLIDELPDGDLSVAHRLLEGLRCGEDDPVLRTLLLAPVDDEPETEEERAAVAEAYEALERGDVFTLDEVKREFGL